MRAAADLKDEVGSQVTADSRVEADLHHVALPAVVSTEAVDFTAAAGTVEVTGN